MNFLARNSFRGLRRVGRLTPIRFFVRPSHGSETYDKAYRLFDMDNDGEITPEELIQILTTVGESPGDLNMYFSGMSDGTITDYRAVVDWLTFCIKHVNLKNPETAEAELISEWKVYDKNGDTSISADNLFDWIEYYYPELTIDQIDHLVDGADIDGDGDINYVAYAQLVCRKILHLDSKPLKSAFDEIDTDHNKELTVEEMSAVTGQDRTSLEDQLAKMDLDHSGTINFIEFLYGIFQTRGESYVMEAFREYDTNNSGFINREELTAWFEKHGGETKNLTELIKGADFNDDGKIDYEEFICMVVKKQI